MTDDLEPMNYGDATAYSKPKLLKQMLLAATLGSISAMVVTSALYLLVTDKTFGYVFAATLLVCGVGFVIRARMQQSASNETSNAMVRVASLGGIAVIFSSISAILAAKRNSAEWTSLLHYSTCGIATLYAISFIGTDWYNRVARRGAQLTARQLYSLSFASVAVGSVCGFLFTLVDVEDHASRLGLEQWCAAALAAAAGGAIGYVNFFARDESLSVAFEPLPMEDFTPTHSRNQFEVDP